MAAPADIDAYIAGLPVDVRPIADEIRRAIHAAAPGCTEKIAYGMPGFRAGERTFLYFAMWKKHVGLYPVYRGSAAFEAKVAAYRAKTDTVQFPLNKPIPIDLVAAIVESQLANAP